MSQAQDQKACEGMKKYLFRQFEVIDQRFALYGGKQQWKIKLRGSKTENYKT